MATKEKLVELVESLSDRLGEDCRAVDCKKWVMDLSTVVSRYTILVNNAGGNYDNAVRDGNAVLMSCRCANEDAVAYMLRSLLRDIKAVPDQETWEANDGSVWPTRELAKKWDLWLELKDEIQSAKAWNSYE